MRAKTFVFRLGEDDDGEKMNKALSSWLAKNNSYSSAHRPPIITQTQSYDRANGMTVVVVNIYYAE